MAIFKSIIRSRRQALLDKFGSLSDEGMRLVVSYYGDSPDAPGFLEQPSEREAMRRFGDALRHYPEGSPLAAEKKPFMDMLGSFSVKTLSRMEKELSACELFEFYGKGSDHNAFERVMAEFRELVDGMEVMPWDFEREVSAFEEKGFVVCSPYHEVMDPSYKPVSKLEKALSEMHLGHNDSDMCFTVEKDGFEALVFEHGGQYLVGGWLYERSSGKCELVSLPDLYEEALKMGKWAERLAIPTDEPVRGRYGAELGRDARWEKALDFNIGNWPEFVGLRYKTFEAGKCIHVLLRDGESRSVGDMSYFRQKDVIEGIKKVFQEANSIYKHLYDSFGDPRYGPWFKLNPSMETIGGDMAEKFVKGVTWTKGVDLNVPGWDAFKSLRALEMPGYTDLYCLLKDGFCEALVNVPLKQLRSLDQAFSLNLKSQMKPKGVKM